jgi:hypothetical protein
MFSGGRALAMMNSPIRRNAVRIPNRWYSSGRALPARQLAALDPGRRLADVGRHSPSQHGVDQGLPTEWDVKTKKNVKWIAELGSQSYGNPVVADGKVFVGTNNEARRTKNRPVIERMCSVSRTASSCGGSARKLASGRANDWPCRGGLGGGRRPAHARSNRGRSGVSIPTDFRTARTTGRSPTRSSPVRTTPTSSGPST